MWTPPLLSLPYQIGKVCFYQFQTHMEDGACVSGYYFKGRIADQFYFAFSVSWFFTAYAVPCACFFVLYGMVAISMQRRKRDSQFESNRYDNFAQICKSTLELQKRISLLKKESCIYKLGQYCYL